MFDKFNRAIDYLRVSVTDRCDQRCVYCMPEAGVPLKRHREILSYEQIEATAEGPTRLDLPTSRSRTELRPRRRWWLIGIAGVVAFALALTGVLVARSLMQRQQAPEGPPLRFGMTSSTFGGGFPSTLLRCPRTSRSSASIAPSKCQRPLLGSQGSCEISRSRRGHAWCTVFWYQKPTLE